MEWRTIPGISRYEASDQGEIRLAGAEKNRKLCVGSHGYWVVNLRDDAGLEKVRLVHRLIALTFHGQPPPGKDWVAHLDDDKLNPKALNLEWQTPKRNADDAVLRGLAPTGERHGNSKLTDRETVEIRQAVSGGELHRIVAARYGVARSIVTRIANGTNRRRVA